MATKTAVKYHFNRETGRAGQCNAKIQCRLGLADSEHFDSKEKAQEAYEKTMENKTTSVVKKNVKGSGKKEDGKNTDVSSHKFEASTSGYAELDGKTASEIRQYMKDVFEQNIDTEDQLRNDIAENLGLTNIPGYDNYGVYKVIDTENGELTVDVPFYENYDPEEYINSYDIDADDYLTEGFDRIEGYMGSTASVGGYYNEDCYVTSRFRVPDGFNDEIEGLRQFRKYGSYYRTATNDNLPDWASVPKNLTMNGKYKQNTNGFNTPPKKSTAKIKKLNKIIDNDKEIQRLQKANRVLAKRSNEALEKLHEIRDYERSDDKRGFVFEKNPEYRGLSKTNRKRAEEKLENSITSFNNQSVSNDRKIHDAENITQADKFKATFELREMNKEYDEQAREYKIEQLSDLYPHSEKSVRDKYATEWVDSHPDLTVDDVM